jgi:NADPH:quinone reductase-like Zn-dependent oxidoreductase
VKAWTIQRYGSPDVLDLTELDKPVPGDDEALVRARTTSANAYDWHNIRGEPVIGRLMGGGLGLRSPKLSTLGADVAGQVEAVGKDVTEFRPSDEVFAVLKQGGFAEYVCVPEGELAPKPKNLSFEQAAAVPMAANTALLGLRDKGRIQPGQKVLINGLGRCGYVRRADRPGVRRGGHRRVQHAEHGSGPIDRRGWGH